MSLSAKTGALTSPLATGNVSYSGVGFQPTVLIFFLNKCAAGSTRAHLVEMIGWTTAASETGQSRATFSADDVGTTSTVVGWGQNPISVMIDNSASESLVARLVSFDSDGFTLNWTSVSGAELPVQWLALAGSGLSVASGNFDTGLGAANVSVVGVGFQPKIVMLLSSRAVDSSGYSATVFPHSRMMFGAAVSTTSRWCAAHVSQDNITAANTHQILTNDFLIYSVNTTVGAVVGTLDFVSFDADGFTVDPVTAFSADTEHAYLCLGGASLSVAVGTESQNASTGTKATTGVGFRPHALILCGVGATALDTDSDHVSSFFGVAASSSDQRVIGVCDTDAADPTVAKSATSSSDCAYYISGTTPTVDGSAALSSFDSDGFTLNWTRADGTTRLFGWIALGLATTTPVSADATVKFSAITASPSTHAMAPAAAIVKFSATAASPATFVETLTAALVRFSAIASAPPIWAFNLFCAFLFRSESQEDETLVSPTGPTPLAGGGGLSGATVLGTRMQRPLSWFRRRREWTKRQR